ncbi:discoidin domain-containing protein [uncultured Pseudodesulfovibrio sp.]|uniref:discoidin domain-containing protein n=1 Tax=uncultured Pseudodesulfovibrio sp. TaxID=2035858 RepID=UPI0029C6B4FC|nr:discoidin domain-containing protein [uncultured Pseudodesulfovibrio sp.]
MDLCHDTDSLPLLCGGSGANVFPVRIGYSALLESGYSSTGAVATDCTIAFGFKPTAASTVPLNDTDGHYLLTIQKQGGTVKVWKQGVQLADYTGAVGATHAEFVANVLVAYCGNSKGYYSRLAIVQCVKSFLDFWELSPDVTGLWRPRNLAGLPLHTLLDFGDAANLGLDVSGNGNDWVLNGLQSDDTPTDNATTREWAEPAILKSSAVADVVLRQGMAGVQQFVGGTPSASSTWPGGSPYGTGYTVEGGFDSANAYLTHADIWMSNEVGGGTLTYDFGEGNTKELSSFGILSSNINETGYSYSPKDFVIEGSLDNKTWTPIVTKTGESFTASNQLKTYPANSPAAYRSYRLRTTATLNGDRVQVGCFYGYMETKVLLPDMEGGPDFVNIKNRDGVSDWILTDSVRGIWRALSTNSDAARVWRYGVTAFNPDGYTLGDDVNVNTGNDKFVDLCLKAGPEQGMAIVPYTGGGVAGQQIAHNLGKAPTFMLVKRTSNVSDWAVYHSALGATKALKLNKTDAVVTSAHYWHDTEPTATHFTVGDWFVGSGSEYIAYLFTDSDIFKAFSYIGNGSVDGPFVNLGGKLLSVPFRKNTSIAANWYGNDTIRSQFNSLNQALYPNESSGEATSASYGINVTSQGFKIPTSAAVTNGSGNLVIGLAILESTKYSNAF